MGGFCWVYGGFLLGLWGFFAGFGCIAELMEFFEPVSGLALGLGVPRITRLGNLFVLKFL